MRHSLQVGGPRAAEKDEGSGGPEVGQDSCGAGPVAWEPYLGHRYQQVLQRHGEAIGKGLFARAEAQLGIGEDI